MIKPVLVSSGEPAGIGPDICLSLARAPYPVVVACDIELLNMRARLLGIDLALIPYHAGMEFIAGSLAVLHVPIVAPVVPGVLNPLNADYVLRMLQTCVNSCKQGLFAALVTAPIQKSVINDAGISFTGHTEFLAQNWPDCHVVMMLACSNMKVALMTTHLPLRQVADAITQDLMGKVILTVHQAMQQHFRIATPKIYVAGLNPHAGEGGHLGREEIDIMLPALTRLQSSGINVQGPFSADTLFVTQNPPDVFIAMYHDQGLPVLKYAGFGDAVNITLGLPIIRTSVDHGTALSIAGSGRASPSSLWAAIAMAWEMQETV